MRKSGWAAAGLGSLVLLLAACGGSSGTTSASSHTSQTSPASQSTSASPSAAASPATSKPSANAAASSSWTTPTPHNTAGAQPSSNVGVSSIPPIGTTVMTIRLTAIGYVLTQASGWVVYTYAKDHKGGAPTCTGSCATTWAPSTGVPQVSPAVTIPGTFGLVTGAGGVKQITYNGLPLYIYKPGGPLVTTGNGSGGVWYVVKMSGSDIHG